MDSTPPRRTGFEPWDSDTELTEEDLREIGRQAARKLRAIIWTKKALRRMNAKTEPEQ